MVLPLLVKMGKGADGLGPVVAIVAKGVAAVGGTVAGAFVLSKVPIPQKPRTEVAKNPLDEAFEELATEQDTLNELDDAFDDDMDGVTEDEDTDGQADDGLPPPPIQPPTPVNIRLFDTITMNAWLARADDAGAFICYDDDTFIATAVVGPPFICPSGSRVVTDLELLEIQQQVIAEEGTIVQLPSDPWNQINWIDFSGIENSPTIQQEFRDLEASRSGGGVFGTLQTLHICHNFDTNETRVILDGKSCPSPWQQFTSLDVLFERLGVGTPVAPPTGGEADAGQEIDTGEGGFGPGGGAGGLSTKVLAQSYGDRFHAARGFQRTRGRVSKAFSRSFRRKSSILSRGYRVG